MLLLVLPSMASAGGWLAMRLLALARQPLELVLDQAETLSSPAQQPGTV
jgi:hypothetical protein